MAMSITNLPVDVLSKIISSVAKLPDGAQDVAKSMTICRLFLEASNSLIVLKVVSFQNVQILGRFRFFQTTNGLLYKCAKTGNPLAEYLLAQVILMTSTQLLNVSMTKARLNNFRGYSPKYKHSRAKARDDTAVASFLAHFNPAPDFTPAKESNPDTPPAKSFHWEFVKEFILKSTPSDFGYMRLHLHNYVQLFAGRRPPSIVFRFLILNWMLFTICTMDENTLLVRESSGNLVRYNRDGFFPPPNVEVIDLSRAGAVFEEIRVEAVDIFKAVIPILR